MHKYIYKSQIKEPSWEEQVIANLLQALAVYQSTFGDDMSDVKRRVMVNAPAEGVRV